MMEVEMKFPVASPAELQARLLATGFQSESPHQEVDRYYNAPDCDFKLTDEALRIRQSGDAVKLTYKGPKQGTTGKVRRELELALAPGTAAIMHDLLLALRYTPSIEVKKTRTIYRHRAQKDIELAWDEVEGLGTYLELELQVPEGDQAQALHVLQAMSQVMGLGPEERRSYLELLLNSPHPAEGEGQG
jgi:adenylate cyclase, class 2